MHLSLACFQSTSLGPSSLERSAGGVAGACRSALVHPRRAAFAPPLPCKRKRSSSPFIVQCCEQSMHASSGDQRFPAGPGGARSASPSSDFSDDLAGEANEGTVRAVDSKSSVSSSSSSAVTATGITVLHDFGDDSSIVAAGGLMTDSVLELKWKAEARGKGWGQLGAGQATTCPPCDGDTSQQIQPIEDPARFYLFTRIAAPTALLGQPERQSTPPLAVANQPPGFDHGRDDLMQTTTIGNDPDSCQDGVEGPPPSHALLARQDGNDDVQVKPDETSAQNFHPYAVASLAQRMLRRMHAKKVQEEFVQYFQGDFDNYEQIAEQRAAGILPREGGGHEHIHCSLRALQDDMLFARYYFNGNPGVVFRSRLYRVVASDTSERGIVEMRIFRFYEETERKLKACNYDIESIEWNDDDMYDWLQGCEVFWERYEPPEGEDDPATLELGISHGTRFVGYMKGGGCELYSREISGRIRVMDDLLLTSDDLWVSDRGFDAAGHFVYGNRKGVPYKMKRVHPDGPAAWTMLASTPAPDGYQS